LAWAWNGNPRLRGEVRLSGLKRTWDGSRGFHPCAVFRCNWEERFGCRHGDFAKQLWGIKPIAQWVY
jgi:hypothetical protein